MKLIIVLLAGLALTSSAEQKEEAGQIAQCECAVFPDDKPAPDAKPLITRTPNLNITCSDPKTKEDCKKMCVALALASKKQAPQVLCEAIKVHVDNMKPAHFYKVCDIAKWENTGLTCNTTICCHEGAPRTCGERGGTSAAPGTKLPKEISVTTAVPPIIEQQKNESTTSTQI